MSSAAQPSVPQRFRRRPKGMIVGKLKAADLLSSERPEGWWEERTEAVRAWLDTNPLRIGVPNDGTVETILAACGRGDRHEQAREKCWVHVLLELEGIAALDVHLNQNDAAGHAPMLAKALDDATVSIDAGCQTDAVEPAVAKTAAIVAAQQDPASSGCEPQSRDSQDSCAAALAIETTETVSGTAPGTEAEAPAQADAQSPTAPVPTSPCRGRLRPSKAAALEVGKAPKSEAQDACVTASGTGGVAAGEDSAAAINAPAPVPPQQPANTDGRGESGESDARQEASEKSDTVAQEHEDEKRNPKRPTAGMSMMERQKAWLAAKEAKLQAQKAQQDQAELEGLTFAPKTRKSSSSWQAARSKLQAGGSAAIAAAAGEGGGKSKGKGKAGSGSGSEAPAAAPRPKPPPGRRPSGQARPIGAGANADKENQGTKSSGAGAGGGKLAKAKSKGKGAKGRGKARRSSKSAVAAGAAGGLMAECLKLMAGVDVTKAECTKLISSNTSPAKIGESGSSKDAEGEVGVESAAAPEIDIDAAEGDVEETRAGASTPRGAPLPPPGSDAEAKAKLAAARKGLGGFAFASKGSTEEKGRFSVADAADFDSSTFFRKRDTGTRTRGVTLVMGNLIEGGAQKVCSILFDREQFSEDAAGQWWEHNCSRFVQ